MGIELELSASFHIHFLWESWRHPVTTLWDTLAALNTWDFPDFPSVALFFACVAWGTIQLHSDKDGKWGAEVIFEVVLKTMDQCL